MAIVVGVAGTQVESIFGKEKKERDNQDFTSAWERRNSRQLDEIKHATENPKI